MVLHVGCRLAAVPALTATLLSFSAAGAIAQQITPVVNGAPVNLQTLPEAMQSAVTATSQDAFSTVFTLGRQIDFILGIGGFPEMETNRDSSFAHEIYQDYLAQQFNNGPFIRTPDLANPFNSSVYSNPAYLRSGQTVPSGEFLFETEPF